MRYDVIVVGAGPAGSTTARECAQRGLSVLLLDKAEFPRDKPCGGAITGRAAHLLPFDLDSVTERRVHSIHMTLRGGREIVRSSPGQLARLTQRSVLDSYLLERAIEASVTLHERAPVREIQRHRSHVVVRTADGTFEGSTLVAADGANGQTSRMAGLDMQFTLGIALEGNISPTNGFPERWQDSIGIDVGDLPGGYGWLFPKGDHLNIGIGGWRHVAPMLRGRLNELVTAYGYDPARLWGVRGHHLPLRNANSPLVDGNVLLVGDAAGLVDPLTGEGIGAAVGSAQMAARHLVAFLGQEEPDLSGYAAEMQQELLFSLAVSRKLHDLFHLTPGLYMAIERHTSLLWKSIRKLVIGDSTYSSMRRRLGFVWPAVEFLSDLIRITPYLQRRAGLQEPAPPERFFLRSARHG